MQPFQLAIAIALSFVVAAALLSVLHLDPDWAEWTWVQFTNARPPARLAVRDAMEEAVGAGCTTWRSAVALRGLAAGFRRWGWNCRTHTPHAVAGRGRQG
jgi:hypothetical protein